MGCGLQWGRLLCVQAGRHDGDDACLGFCRWLALALSVNATEVTLALQASVKVIWYGSCDLLRSLARWEVVQDIDQHCGHLLTASSTQHAQREGI